MGIKEDIKSIIVKSGFSIIQVSEELNKKFNRNTTPQNLYKKINNETLKFKDVIEIADVIGYECQWVKKQY